MQFLLAEYLEEEGMEMSPFSDDGYVEEYSGKIVAMTRSNADNEAMDPINTHLLEMYNEGDVYTALALYIKVSEVCNPSLTPFCNSKLSLLTNQDFCTIAVRAFPPCSVRATLWTARKKGHLLETDTRTKTATVILNMSYRFYYLVGFLATKLDTDTKAKADMCSDMSALLLPVDKVNPSNLTAILKCSYGDSESESESSTEYSSD